MNIKRFHDVKSLFTNVLLDKTIDTILKKAHNQKKTSIPKSNLKELLHLCTKQLQSTFNAEIYIQCDGVAIEFPLHPILANIFVSCNY